MSNRGPFYLQLGEHDCALACLRMVLHHHGFKPPISQLIKLFPISFGGISLFDLETAFSKLGFGTATIKLDLDAVLSSEHLPVILYLSENHYVVLFSKEDDEYLIGDPAIGKRLISREKLESLWLITQHQKGIALLVEPEEANQSILKAKQSDTLSFEQFYIEKKSALYRTRLKQHLNIIFQIFSLIGASFSLYSASNSNEDKMLFLLLFVFFTFIAIISDIFSKRGIKSLIQSLQIRIHHEFSSRFLNNANALLDPWIQSWSSKSNWLIESFLQVSIQLNYYKIQFIAVLLSALIGLFILEVKVGYLMTGLAIALIISLYIIRWIGRVENYEYFEKSVKSYDLYQKIVRNRFYVQMFGANEYFKTKWETQESAAFKDRISFTEKRLIQHIFHASLLVLVVGVGIGILLLWFFHGYLTTGVFTTSLFLILVVTFPLFLFIQQDRFFQEDSFSETLESYWELASAPNTTAQKIGSFNQLGLQAKKWGLDVQFKLGDKVAVVTDNAYDRKLFFEKLLNQPVKLNFNDQAILRQDGIQDLAYIDEDAKIYEDSIFNNISFGAPSDLNSLLKVVNLDADIKNQPAGIDTLIQTDYISESLKIKLLAARALFKNAPLSILNLDLKRAEPHAIGGSIEKIVNTYPEQTIFWFASDPSQIPTLTTHIIVFKNGEILEVGSPKQLSIIKGYFYRFFKHSSFG